MARVVWSRIARDDLQGIIAYIRTDAPAYARSFALRLNQRVSQLETFPESGRFVSEDPGLVVWAIRRIAMTSLKN